MAMQRIDIFHKTPEENVNTLFNRIQACRTDLSILKYNLKTKPLLEKDTELIKCAEALVREIK
jgi:hypothetical protein